MTSPRDKVKEIALAVYSGKANPQEVFDELIEVVFPDENLKAKALIQLVHERINKFVQPLEGVYCSDVEIYDGVMQIDFDFDQLHDFDQHKEDLFAFLEQLSSEYNIKISPYLRITHMMDATKSKTEETNTSGNTGDCLVCDNKARLDGFCSDACRQFYYEKRRVY
jgi:hypothetical protein